MRTFVDEFIIPSTRGTGMGYALHVNGHKPRRVNLMVSHSWDENAQQFLRDLHSHMQKHEDGIGPYIVEQLGTHQVEDGPFFRVLGFIADRFYAASDFSKRAGLSETDYKVVRFEVMKNCPVSMIRALLFQVAAWPWLLCCPRKYQHRFYKHMCHGRMLVVANEFLKDNGQGLYSRLWCVYEIAAACRLHVPVEFTNGTSEEHLFGRSASCRTARCGNPSESMNRDEEMIRHSIETNSVLQRYARSWFGPNADVYAYLDSLLRSLSSGTVHTQLHACRRKRLCGADGHYH